MCVCLMFACQPLKAATITYADKATFMSASISASIVLDTEDFNALADGAEFHTTPLDVGPFTLSMTGPAATSPGHNEIDAPVVMFPDFDVNGTTIASVLTEDGVSLFLTFDAPITAFGVDLANFNDSINQTHIVVAGVTSIPAVIGDNLRFFGIISDASFSTVEFRGLENDGFGMDNVMYGTVPVPPAVWLFGSGLIGLVGIARRKNATFTGNQPEVVYT